MNFLKTFLAGVLAFVVGCFLVCYIGMMLLVSMAGLAGSFEKAVSVPDGSILEINLDETITDSPATNPLAEFDFATMTSRHSLPVLKAMGAIEAAAADSRIRGIYLRLNGAGGIAGSALMEELRGAIADFRQSGKFVVSYNEVYNQGAYYLASVADSVYLHPEGGMDWSGLAFNLTFYKGLLDKLDLHAEVFRPTVCKYKSAVEPYILDRMSDANRLQMQELVNSIWGTLVRAVSDARGISPEELNRMADNLEVVLPEDALEKGLVDGLLYEDQMNDVFASYGLEPDAEGHYSFVTLGDYAAQTGFGAASSLSQPAVAVVYADGSIVDGEGYELDKIYGNTLARTLAGVRADESVKAVVLRVNSPGGSALASDIIWRELELLRAEKPVIVSMGSYAASGGYYISCPADAIVSDRLTLTGSIGVFGMYLYTPDALKNKLGITLDGVKSNRSAGMGSISPLTPAERASIMRGVDKVYATFTGNVAQGRNLPLERVLEIAGGRVWSGEDALDIGLVDGIGGLREAIALAADKAELGDDFRVKEVVEQPEGLWALLSELGVSVRQQMLRSELGGMMKEYRQVQELTSQQGVVMYCPWQPEWR
ncbi:signal peptide peptidase SppA [uncultured Alistipes sp.]|uniref:signal peptide peptidase SppA n=1 Tax=uncultured Alistipes sp. TaxID=538949 RepID=UPI00266BF1F9|nr:signal peptide peptidase SppA [uncultured Alistipes sp.]